jgi:hypothetical protein
MRSLAYLFVALFPALFTYGGVKQRLDTFELARDGGKMVGTVVGVEVVKNPVFPDSFYLLYAYSPPGNLGSVDGRVGVSRETAKALRAGMPVDVRVHRFYKDRHATIPYHVDMARDWLWPIAYALLTLTFLYQAWMAGIPARRRDD